MIDVNMSDSNFLPTYWAAVEADSANWASINFGINVAIPLSKLPER
jgi:hypothetical protein